MHDWPAIVRAILADYPLAVYGEHGVVHWARVWENGAKLAEATGADAEIVSLFALFHDSRRINQSQDRGHGERGGDFARQLRGSLVHLDDPRFEILYEACRHHTEGHTNGDLTMRVCWDADRLDLGRVYIKPAPNRLGTDAARQLIAWAHERASFGHEPKALLQSWAFLQNQRTNAKTPRSSAAGNAADCLPLTNGSWRATSFLTSEPGILVLKNRTFFCGKATPFPPPVEFFALRRSAGQKRLSNQKICL